MTTILVAKKKKFTRNGHMRLQSPIVALDKWQKTTNYKKNPHGMHSHPYSCILFTTARIFHSLTSYKTMRL
jgi:hypothetical protein